MKQLLFLIKLGFQQFKFISKSKLTMIQLNCVHSVDLKLINYEKNLTFGSLASWYCFKQ